MVYLIFFHAGDTVIHAILFDANCARTSPKLRRSKRTARRSPVICFGRWWVKMPLQKNSDGVIFASISLVTSLKSETAVDWVHWGTIAFGFGGDYYPDQAEQECRSLDWGLCDYALHAVTTNLRCKGNQWWKRDKTDRKDHLSTARGGGGSFQE